MKAVKCVYNDDVLLFDKEWVRIMNDDGIEGFYYLEDSQGVWFEDATAYIRDKKLSELGI